MRENFFDSAIRHWVDGKILEEEKEFDNAVCMQGFAVECALKAILAEGLSDSPEADKLIKNYSHSFDELLEDMGQMLMSDIELTTVINPSCGIRLSKINLSEKVLEDHPGRRYYSDDTYGKEDAVLCRENTEACLKEMIRLYIDGYIGDKEGE